MPKKILSALILFALARGAQAKGERTVFLLSIDGFAGSYLPNKALPQFIRMQSEGATAGKLTPVFPSLTFPNHLSLATGCPPGKHGVVGNQFIDKNRGRFHYADDSSWLECEPIWVAAERQGVKTALFSWPMGTRAWNGVEASRHLPAFDKKNTDAKALDQLVAWAALPKAERPRLLMTYLSGPDHLGHEAGPASGKVQAALEKTDRLLEDFAAKLAKVADLGPYAIVLVSDHGMAPVKEGVQIDSLFERYFISGVPVVSGPLLYLYLWNPAHASKVAKDLAATDGLRAYLPKDLPTEFGPYHPRMGDVVGVLDMPKVFLRGSETRGKLPNGAHGYDPRVPAMDGIFVAWGDGIKKKSRFPEARALDVAATIAKLLEINAPKQNQGKPIAEALE